MIRRRPLLTWAALAAAAIAAMAVPVRAEPEDRELGEKFALLAAVQEYDGELGFVPYAEKDVLALAEVLKEVLKVPPGNIVLMTRQASNSPRRTPTRGNILEQLELIGSLLRPQDTLIVALVGQGVQPRDAEPSFCPEGTRLDDLRTAIPLSTIQRSMEKSRAGLRLLLVEASRIEPGDRSRRAAGKEQDQAENGGKAAEAIGNAGPVSTIWSCSRGERSQEDSKSRNGVFFRCVIDGLRGGADLDQDGLATLGEFQRYVAQNVRNLVLAQYAAVQQPEFSGSASPKEILVALKPASLLLKRGKDLLERGKYDEVITDCTRLLQFDPRSSEVYHLRGKARAMDSRDGAAAAIEDFTAAIRYARGFGEAYLDRGLLYVDTGEPDEGISDLNMAQQLGKNSLDLFFFRGLASLQKNRYKEAIADFDAALRLKPDLADAWINRSVAHYRLDQFKEALADAQRAITVDPKLARGYLCRGVARLKLGDVESAISDFDLTLQQGRRAGDRYVVSSAYLDRGQAFLVKKDYPRAIEDLEHIVRNLGEADSLTLDLLGQAYAGSENQTRATRCFEDAVRLDTTRSFAPAHLHLGAARYKERDYPGAIKECSTAIEIDPVLADAYTTRGMAYQALREFDKALADAKKVEKLRKKN